MTKKELIKVAKLEIAEWRGLPNGIALIILFAFIHRLTTGDAVEETFFKPKRLEPDYEI